MSKCHYYKDIYNLPPEKEEANLEYKRYITATEEQDKERFDRLLSQLNWRIHEGKRIYGINEAYYYIGINDDGTISDINETMVDTSIKNLRMISQKINYSLDVIEFQKSKSSSVAICKIYNNNDEIINSDLLIGKKIIFIGPENHGKSSLLGSLVYNIKDNEQGLSRQYVATHEHEFLSGNTSSIHYEKVKIHNNKIVNMNENHDMFDDTPELNDHEYIYLIDLPGNEQYFKTSIYGLTSYYPDKIFMIFNMMFIENLQQNNNELSFIVDWINICINIGISFKILLTHSDKYNEFSMITLQRKFMNYINNLIYDETYYLINDDILLTSSITYHNFDKIIHEMLIVSKPKYNMNLLCDNKLFLANEIIDIPHIGIVIHGINKGNEIINIKDNVTIQYSSSNRYEKAMIKSIHINQKEYNKLMPNVMGTLLINRENIKLSKKIFLCSNISEINQIQKVTIKLLANIHKNIATQNTIYGLLFFNNYVEPVTVIKKYNDDNTYVVNFDKPIFYTSKDIFLKSFGIIKDQNQNLLCCEFISF